MQSGITDRKAGKGWRGACKLLLPYSYSCWLVYSCPIRLETIFLTFTSEPISPGTVSAQRDDDTNLLETRLKRATVSLNVQLSATTSLG